MIFLRLRNWLCPQLSVESKHKKARRKPHGYASKKRIRRQMAKKSRQRNAAKMKGRS